MCLCTLLLNNNGGKVCLSTNFIYPRGTIRKVLLSAARLVCAPLGDGAAVLLRSLEPLQGQDVMRSLRASKRKEGAKALKDRDLCNGPSKLCQALDVQRCLDRGDLASDVGLWLETDADWVTPGARDVVSASRVGIESHGEWATKPLRFYLRGHPCVSVVDRAAESQQ